MDRLLFENKTLTTRVYPALCKMGLTPNAVTFVGIMASLVIPFTYATSPSITMSMILLKLVSDCVDGPVARTCKSASLFGARLDLTADFLFNTVMVYVFLRLLGKPADLAFALTVFLVHVYILYIWYFGYLPLKEDSFAFVFTDNSTIVLLGICALYYFLYSRRG